MKNLCYLLFLLTSINLTYAQDFKKIRAGEPELTFVHLAGLTKYVFESDSDPNNSDEAMLYAAKTVIQYVQNKENKVKLNAALKKLIAADRNNQLLEYLKKK